MVLRIGWGFPTCREGQTYSVPYVRQRELATVARRAEQLGYYSLWGNDHLATPHVIRNTLTEPANFYEPILTFATLANVTERLRFMLSILVLPQREPVLLAKQIATLDVLSEGRVMLGVGIGGYRDELEAVRPDLKQAHRGTLLDEGLQSLRLLFDERVASFEGKYIQFADVDLAPKPHQRPFPILLSSGSAGLRRVARLADGWIAASAPAGELTAQRQQLDAALTEHGRNPASVETHVQVWICFGRDVAAAETKLRSSQHFRRLVVHGPGHSEESVLARFRAGGFFGTPQDVIEQIRAYERAGVAHLGIIPVGDSMDDLVADMELFAERVLPAFPQPA